MTVQLVILSVFLGCFSVTLFFIGRWIGKKEERARNKIHACLVDVTLKNEDRIVTILDKDGLSAYVNHVLIFKYTGDADLTIFPDDVLESVNHVAIWPRHIDASDFVYDVVEEHEGYSVAQTDFVLNPIAETKEEPLFANLVVNGEQRTDEHGNRVIPPREAEQGPGSLMFSRSGVFILHDEFTTPDIVPLPSTGDAE